METFPGEDAEDEHTYREYEQSHEYPVECHARPPIPGSVQGESYTFERELGFARVESGRIMT